MANAGYFKIVMQYTPNGVWNDGNNIVVGTNGSGADLFDVSANKLTCKVAGTSVRVIRLC